MEVSHLAMALFYLTPPALDLLRLKIALRLSLPMSVSSIKHSL
jgi:hypothetical protein